MAHMIAGKHGARVHFDRTDVPARHPMPPVDQPRLSEARESASPRHLRHLPGMNCGFVVAQCGEPASSVTHAVRHG